MVFYRPAGPRGNRVFLLDWRRAGDASLELADATSLRMAPDYLLAGFRIACALPDSVRRLGWPRPSLQYAPAHAGAHGRALGEDDARGARKVPPELARTLRQFRNAIRRNQGVGLMAEPRLFGRNECAVAGDAEPGVVALDPGVREARADNIGFAFVCAGLAINTGHYGRVAIQLNAQPFIV